MTWGPDGILFGQGSKGVMHVPDTGGTPELVADVRSDELAYGPQALPGGRGTMFTVAPGRGQDRWDRARIVVQTSKGSEPKTLIERGSDARYLPNGLLVYALEGRLFAASFDLRTLTATEPVSVLEGVARGGGTGAAQFSVSNTGSLIYIPGPVSASPLSQFNLGLVDQTGKLELLKLPPGGYESPRVSPDGKQIALGIGSDKEANIWIYDLAGTSNIRRLTFGDKDRFPVWSADGRYIVFQSERDGDRAIFWQRADFSGTAERLTRPEPGTSHIPEAWWPQGELFTYSIFSERLRRFSLSSFAIREKQSHPLDRISSTSPLASNFSPDGRWLVYSSSEAVTGMAQTTVFVEPFPPTGAKYQISELRNGFHGTWLPDGKRLTYSIGVGPAGPQWVIVNLTLLPRFTIGSAVNVPNGGMVDSVPWRVPSERNYDFTPEGKRIGIVPISAAASPGRLGTERSVRVVLNWFEELKQRLPAPRGS